MRNKMKSYQLTGFVCLFHAMNNTSRQDVLRHTYYTERIFTYENGMIHWW